MNKYIILVILTLALGTVKSQTNDFGIQIASNVNFVTFSSEYDIDNTAKQKPGIGYNLGLVYLKQLDKFSVQSSIEFQHTSNRLNDDFVRLDLCGVPTFSTKQVVKINTLGLNLIGIYNINKNIYVGAGISASYLLNSNLTLGEKLEQFAYPDRKRFAINYYNKVLFSVPITIGYKYNKWNFFARFNKGLTNKIKVETFMKEFDNPILFGVSYPIL